jgi:hypothetical protein
MFQTQCFLNVFPVHPANLILEKDFFSLKIEQRVQPNDIPALTAPEPVPAVMDQDVHGRKLEVFS